MVDTVVYALNDPPNYMSDSCAHVAVHQRSGLGNGHRLLVTLVTPFSSRLCEKLIYVVCIYSDVIGVTRVVQEISVTGTTTGATVIDRHL